MKIIRENRESAGNILVIKMCMGQIYLISGNVVPPCSLQGTEAFHSPPFVAEFVNNYKQYSFINNSHSFIICRFVGTISCHNFRSISDYVWKLCPKTNRNWGINTWVYNSTYSDISVDFDIKLHFTFSAETFAPIIGLSGSETTGAESVARIRLYWNIKISSLLYQSSHLQRRTYIYQTYK